MKKTAIITGITGQDSSYLAELLLEKDYIVCGLKRRSSTDTNWRINHILDNPNLNIEECDITDATNVNRIVSQIKPDEFYNLGAMSFVGTSFSEPVATFTVNAIGPLNILEAIRQNSPKTKFYQASTSELFGDTKIFPQNEDTPFMPRSPYGISKLSAHHTTKMYREAYNIFACNGILFNHESNRRGNEFVTRKITRYVAKLQKASNGLKEIGKLALGNLEAQRDFGYAPEYCKAMWLMLQQDEPQDFVIATGETHSIREFLNLAFGCINISNWSEYVEIDPKFFRPSEVNVLCGDASKAKKILGWEPKVKFEELVKIMVKADLG